MRRLKQYTAVSEQKLKRLDGLYFPSIPAPQVLIETVQVTRIYRGKGKVWRYDLAIKGTVTCAVCDLIPGEAGTITEGFYRKDDSWKPHGTYAIVAHKSEQQDLRRPFPFHGTIDTTITGLCVDSGRLQFEVLNPIFGINGFSTWKMTFDYPDNDELNGANKPSGPVSTKPPRNISGGGGGELHPILLGVEADSPVNQITLGGTSFKLIDSPQGDCKLLADRNSSHPAYFVWAPGPNSCHEELNIQDLLGEAAITDPRQRFLSGYFLGNFATGWELIHLNGTSTNIPIIPQRLPEAAVLEFCADGQTENFPIIPDFREPPPAPDSSLPEIFLQIIEGIKAGATKISDLRLELLLRNFAELGVKSPVSRDGRSDLLVAISQLISGIIAQHAHESWEEVGYALGRTLGETLKLGLRAGCMGSLREDRSWFELMGILSSAPFFQHGNHHDLMQEILRDLGGI